MDVHFIDSTFRDGSQSLWAMALRSGMIEAVAKDMDESGFDAIELPLGALHQKKFIRYWKENPWDMARMAIRAMPKMTFACMAGAAIPSWESPVPEITELFFTHLAEIGGLQRVQIISNTLDQTKRDFPWFIPILKKLGAKVALALAYTISPRHTDAYYAEKTRELLSFKPDWFYLKDQGGVLTVDRVRTLLPAIVQAANGVPVELHSHCTTGLAPLVYLEALRLGINTLHTAIPPLAQGSGQPSVLNMTRNARLMGHSPIVNDERVERVSERLTAIARHNKLPIGAPLEHDYGQYIHQVPGGVISNLKFQLAELGLQDRLDEVLAECVAVRKDMGYPIMITPHSQFVVTQAAINVRLGERYKVVIDEVIQFARGVFGEESGYTWMDQNLKDRLLSSPRAGELAARKRREVSLKEVREAMGSTGISDEEFLLRYIMKGEEEIKAMRAAGPPRRYDGTHLPLLTLIEELEKQKRVRYIQVRRGDQSLVMEKRATA